jgi:hypothetical protein
LSTVPTWLAVTQSTATTLGVLIALYIAAWREPRKARAERAESDRKAQIERDRHDEQMSALLRAENDRIAAQARKVVPTAVPTSVFGKGMWSVKVSNLSNAPITDLGVRVVAIDAQGTAIPDACEQANGKIATGELFSNLLSDAIGAAVGTAVGRANPLAGMLGGMGGMNGAQMGALAGPQIAPRIQPALQEALNGHLADEWMTTLTPDQNAVMAYSVSAEGARLRVEITFTDEAGYRWSRTDNGGPTRLDDTA